MFDKLGVRMGAIRPTAHTRGAAVLLLGSTEVRRRASAR